MSMEFYGAKMKEYGESEEYQKRANTCMKNIKKREDPTITACRNLDKSTPDFSEEKAAKNFRKFCDTVMEPIIKKAYD